MAAYVMTFTDSYAAHLIKYRNMCRSSGHRWMGVSAEHECIRCSNINRDLRRAGRNTETGAREERIAA